MPGPTSTIGAFRFGVPSLPNIPIIGGLYGVTWPWSLENLENGEASNPIVGDFFPESMVYNVGGASFAEASSINRDKPIVQYSGGALDSIAFNALLFSRYFLDNIEERVEAIKALVRRDPVLKRPPVCLFEVGSISFQCFVTNVGGIKISEVRNNGMLRSVEFGITLMEYVAFDVKSLEQTNPSNLEPSTFYKTAKQGDTYESVASEEYGDPMKGVSVRLMNPTLGVMLEPGDRVMLLPPEHSKSRAQVEPVSIAMANRLSHIKTMFDEKQSDKRVSYVRR